MYAVFKTGGKQYRASQGDALKVEKLEAERWRYGRVQRRADGRRGRRRPGRQAQRRGQQVTAKVGAQGRTGKVSIIKFKRRTHYKRMKTHRQEFTLVEITAIAAA